MPEGGRDNKRFPGIDTGGVTLTEGSGNGSKSPTDKMSESSFNQWSEMENAEEMTFINDEQGDAALEQLLDKEFPNKMARQQSDFSQLKFWRNKLSGLVAPEPNEPGL